MRTMHRNKQRFWYALFVGTAPIVDENGNKTGEYETSYTDPIEAKMNISAARGYSDVELFGVQAQYSKTIVTDDVNCPIDENSILWIDREPTEPHNYVVTGVAKSLNSITYAVKRVDVT